MRNPCTGTINNGDCERWKRDFPKEYAKYHKRLKKSAEADKRTSAAVNLPVTGRKGEGSPDKK
jgi:hypothetical protein